MLYNFCRSDFEFESRFKNRPTLLGYFELKIEQEINVNLTELLLSVLQEDKNMQLL